MAFTGANVTEAVLHCRRHTGHSSLHYWTHTHTVFCRDQQLVCKFHFPLLFSNRQRPLKWIQNWFESNCSSLAKIPNSCAFLCSIHKLSIFGFGTVGQNMLVCHCVLIFYKQNYIWKKQALDIKHIHTLHLGRLINVYILYSPYSQITVCLIGLNKVWHPLFLTLNKSETTKNQNLVFTLRIWSEISVNTEMRWSQKPTCSHPIQSVYLRV